MSTQPTTHERCGPVRSKLQQDVHSTNHSQAVWPGTIQTTTGYPLNQPLTSGVARYDPNYNRMSTQPTTHERCGLVRSKLQQDVHSTNHSRAVWPGTIQTTTGCPLNQPLTSGVARYDPNYNRMSTQPTTHEWCGPVRSKLQQDVHSTNHSQAVWPGTIQTTTGYPLNQPLTSGVARYDPNYNRMSTQPTTHERCGPVRSKLQQDVHSTNHSTAVWPGTIQTTTGCPLNQPLNCGVARYDPNYNRMSTQPTTQLRCGPVRSKLQQYQQYR
ncbi:hypothetical protein O0L34_g668 [Tuta absoluta]|nr:hypothetical protein O0L34_g668 [Tuta absoluta]